MSLTLSIKKYNNPTCKKAQEILNDWILENTTMQELESLIDLMDTLEYISK